MGSRECGVTSKIISFLHKASLSPFLYSSAHLPPFDSFNFLFSGIDRAFFLFFIYGSIAPASASIDAHSHNIDFAALVESQSEPVLTAPLPPKRVNEPEAKVTSSIEEALMVGGEYEIKEALNLGGEDAINPRI